MVLKLKTRFYVFPREGGLEGCGGGFCALKTRFLYVSQGRVFERSTSLFVVLSK